MQFRAQAESMPALASFVADALKSFRLGQFTDRYFKDLGCRIKFQSASFYRLE